MDGSIARVLVRENTEEACQALERTGVEMLGLSLSPSLTFHLSPLSHTTPLPLSHITSPSPLSHIFCPPLTITHSLSLPLFCHSLTPSLSLSLSLSRIPSLSHINSLPFNDTITLSLPL